MELIEKPESELSRSDIRMIGTAIRKGWDIPEEALAKVPKKMLAIINRRKGGSDRDRIAAANVLVAMLKNSQPKIVGHLHQHHHSESLVNQEISIESRREENARRLDRIKRLGGDA